MIASAALFAHFPKNGRRHIVTLTRWAALVAAGLVSACGGGGGGDGPTGPQPIRTTMQGPSTTKDYNASSAAFRFELVGATDKGIEAVDAGSLVTITTDSKGYITNLAIDTNTANVGFFGEGQPLGPPGGGVPSNADVLNDLAAGVKEVLSGEAGSYGIAILDLNHSMFGGWVITDSAPGGWDGRAGVFAFGVETATMPATGEATYNGTAMGVGVTGSQRYAFAGDAQVKANFAGMTVQTTFSNLNYHNVINNDTGTLATLSGSGTITGHKYSGTISGGSGTINGTVQGAFYGPGAAETAGVFQATGGGTTLMGSYGAKK